MMRQIHLHGSSVQRATPFVAYPGQRVRSAARRMARVNSITNPLVCLAAAEGEEKDSASRKAGRSTYRPSSYTELIDDAVASIVFGVQDNLKRMEVEFPSVSNVDGYKGSSDLYIDSNIQLAISAARKIFSTTAMRVHIMLPDEAEYRRAYKLFKSALETSDGVTLGHLMEGKSNFLSSLTSQFGLGESCPDPTERAKQADIYISANASTVELKELEEYTNAVVKDKPLVTWNMELDNLRADLGLLGFPPKDLQYRFLSTIKPVFYIRQRDYSKTVAVAPFIINYSGALFREYPGPWQVMLRQDNGVYACVAEDSDRRYPLGEFKAELTRAMGLDVEPEGSTMAFLRTGYKTTTWWEDDIDKEESNDWRS